MNGSLDAPPIVISPSLEVTFRMAVVFGAPLERVFQYDNAAAARITLD